MSGSPMALHCLQIMLFVHMQLVVEGMVFSFALQHGGGLMLFTTI